MYDRELDILSAPDSREAFSQSEQEAYDERMAMYAEADADGFFDDFDFEMGGEG